MEMLELSFDEFDQNMKGGWRTIAHRRKYRAAANLLLRYRRRHRFSDPGQPSSLTFHAGQMYAFAGMNKRAALCFRKTRNKQESVNPVVRWNAYVDASIAFLQRDKRTLHACRAHIARTPKWQGQVPNLAIIDGFLANFEYPYAIAYGGGKHYKPACKTVRREMRRLRFKK